MATLSTDVLVIGGGATGAGVDGLDEPGGAADRRS